MSDEPFVIIDDPTPATIAARTIAGKVKLGLKSFRHTGSMAKFFDSEKLNSHVWDRDSQSCERCGLTTDEFQAAPKSCAEHFTNVFTRCERCGQPTAPPVAERCVCEDLKPIEEVIHQLHQEIKKKFT